MKVVEHQHKDKASSQVITISSQLKDKSWLTVINTSLQLKVRRTKMGYGHPRRSTWKRDRSILYIVQISVMPFPPPQKMLSCES